jgi:hypothetical protein
VCGLWHRSAILHLAGTRYRGVRETRVTADEIFILVLVGVFVGAVALLSIYSRRQQPASEMQPSPAVEEMSPPQESRERGRKRRRRR